ncbi:MAG: hypothetical protein EOP83_10175 [Verrucomicrobiaceae bacterium]|nr:MAG: hypothetical protein EOP83_10175 [Verrucomicrobiaceae bacterium]
MATRLARLAADGVATGLPKGAASSITELTKPEEVRGIVEDVVKQLTRSHGAETDDSAPALATDIFVRTAKLSLVHAARRPLARPSADIAGERLPATAITIRADGEGAWQKLVTAAKGAENLRSEAGGSTTYFVGSISLHRETSELVRCEASWLEMNADSVKRSGSGFAFRPDTSETRLFEINDLKRTLGHDNITDDSTHDLLYRSGETVEGSQLSELRHEFRDARVRRLSCRLVATSRYRNHYPQWRDENAAGTFESRSDVFEIWTTSTRRPTAVTVASAAPYFTYERKLETASPGRRFVLKRTGGVRVEFQEAWHDTGEGEKVGVVFASDPSEAQQPDHPLYQLASKWGSDPTHLAHPISQPLSAGNIRGWNPVGDGTGARVMHLPVAEEGTQSRTVKVNITSKEPTLDPQTGKWFADLEFEADASAGGAGIPEKAYWPFVRLGLVRYQPRSVDGLELSTCTVHTVKPPPWRVLTVGQSTSRRRLDIKLAGPAPRDPSSDVRTKRTVVTARLVNAWDRDDAPANPHGSGWRDIIDHDGNRLRVEMTPYSGPPEKEWPESGAGIRTWQARFNAPGTIRSEKLALVVEEFEEFETDALDVSATDPTSGPPRRLVFAGTIDLSATTTDGIP